MQDLEGMKVVVNVYWNVVLRDLVTAPDKGVFVKGSLPNRKRTLLKRAAKLSGGSVRCCRWRLQLTVPGYAYYLALIGRLTEPFPDLQVRP